MSAYRVNVVIRGHRDLSSDLERCIVAAGLEGCALTCEHGVVNVAWDQEAPSELSARCIVVAKLKEQGLTGFPWEGWEHAQGIWPDPSEDEYDLMVKDVGRIMDLESVVRERGRLLVLCSLIRRWDEKHVFPDLGDEKDPF